MQENRSKIEWTAARGEKWRQQLAPMEAMLAPVNEPLIRALGLDAACRIAEVGCGGGGTSLELARRAPAGSVIHGFDISPALIEVARRRGSATGSLAFHVADMETAVPPAGLFDRLVSRFGVMFFSDPPAAFRSLIRWLAPAGRFAFAVWGPLPDNPWMSILRETVAEFIAVPPRDPDEPGPFRYGDVSRFLQILDGAGYRDLEVIDWRGMLPMGGELPAEEASEFALASFSTFAEMLSEAGDGVLRNAQARLAQRLSAYEQDGAVWMGARVHIVTGEVAAGGGVASPEVCRADRD